MNVTIARILKTGLACAMFALAGLAVSCVEAQPAQPGVHYYHAGLRSPGFIGQSRLIRGDIGADFYQPVSIQGPRGMLFSMAYAGAFTDLQAAPNTVGLQVGRVYRLRITRLPFPGYEGRELYPTVEVIDKMYPPAGKELNHPVIVYFAPEDLKLAADGKFVTRVVYVEDPKKALPVIEPALKRQGYIDIGNGGDPLAVADSLGRPVAIIRIGGRTPTASEGMLTDEFLFGSPSFINYNQSISQPRRSVTTLAPAPEGQPKEGAALGQPAAEGAIESPALEAVPEEKSAEADKATEVPKAADENEGLFNADSLLDDEPVEKKPAEDEDGGMGAGQEDAGAADEGENLFGDEL